MSKYVSVHIQFKYHGTSIDELVDMAAAYSKTGTPTIEDVDFAIDMINKERAPRTSYPTYIADGAQIGDLVKVPYGNGFYPIGLVVGYVDEADLNENVNYKPVYKILGSV